MSVLRRRQHVFDLDLKARTRIPLAGCALLLLATSLQVDAGQLGEAEANEVRRVVAAAQERGAKVTAHSGRLSGARVCAEAEVDCVEHGFELDEDCARLMSERGIALVSTLTVLKSNPF